MATVDASPESIQPVAEAPAPAGLLAGDPQSLGLPSFIVGSVALGLVLLGFVPATAVGSSLPIILAATGLGLLVSTFWAMAVGQSAVACVFGVFAGFWISYALLVLGLLHGWFGIAAADAKSSQELFLTVWLIGIVLLTVVTLRLPLAFTVVLGLVSLALLFVLLATINASTGLQKLAGIIVLVFAAVGAYIFAGTAATATGGSALPLGRPVIH